MPLSAHGEAESSAPWAPCVRRAPPSRTTAPWLCARSPLQCRSPSTSPLERWQTRRGRSRAVRRPSAAWSHLLRPCRCDKAKEVLEIRPCLVAQPIADEILLAGINHGLETVLQHRHNDWIVVLHPVTWAPSILANPSCKCELMLPGRLHKYCKICLEHPSIRGCTHHVGVYALAACLPAPVTHPKLLPHILLVDVPVLALGASHMHHLELMYGLGTASTNLG